MMVLLANLFLGLVGIASVMLALVAGLLVCAWWPRKNRKSLKL